MAEEREQLKQVTARGAQLTKPPLLRLFCVQTIVLLVITATLLLIQWVTAYSALLGGLIAIVPNAYFARWAFRFSGAQVAVEVAQSFYRGEAGKFLLTAVLFASVFALVKPLDAVAVFLTYVFMVALNWILALRFLK